MASTTRDPDLSRTVEKQMRNWELARSQRPSHPVTRRPEVEEFLCVSRMVGMDTTPVTEALTRRLRWPVFDRQVLEVMADDDDFRRRIYETMDERDLSWFEQTVRSFLQHRFIRTDYFRQLTRTLLSLARQGSCVFVGRGADLILPHDRGFRVRLAASRKRRIDELAERRGTPRAAAERELERSERERNEFFRHHFGLDADDPSRFDLCINLERMGPEKTVETILAVRRIHQEERPG